MLIIDAMRRADTPQEVCFLLESYVETLQFYDTAKHLSPGAAVLPINGLADIESRLEGLHEAQRRVRNRQQRRSDGPVIDEAANVFSEALCCWKALERFDLPPPAHNSAAAVRTSPG